MTERNRELEVVDALIESRDHERQVEGKEWTMIYFAVKALCLSLLCIADAISELKAQKP